MSLILDVTAHIIIIVGERERLVEGRCCSSKPNDTLYNLNRDRDFCPAEKLWLVSIVRPVPWNIFDTLVPPKNEEKEKPKKKAC